VVDICSGRRACALGVSKTHCKVRFEASGTGWPPHEEQEKVEIIPLERVRAWTSSWDGKACPGGLSGSAPDPQHLLVLPALPARIAARRMRPVRDVPLHLQGRVAASSPRGGGGSSGEDEDDDGEGTALPSRRRPDLLRELAQDTGQAALVTFRNTAKAHFGGHGGSLFAAWRTALDVRGTGRVRFEDLVRGGRLLGFHGNYRKLWDELTGGHQKERRSIGLEALDPEGANLIHDFMHFLEARDMTMEDLWEDHLDNDGSGRCPCETFVSTMGDLGWNGGRARALFRMLDIGGQQDLSFDELGLVGLRRRKAKAERKRTLKEVREERDRALCSRMVADFHGFLIRNFGSVVRAWRLGLDGNQDGKLNFNEFCGSCKKIGFRGRLKTLWRALDTDGTGYISLGELDPYARDLMEQFVQFLEENYRTLDDVWERVFDKNHSGRCTQEDFVVACKEKLDWHHGVLQIFKWLDLNARRDLTVDEMEFLGMRRRVVGSTAKQKILERQAKDRAEAEAMLGRFRLFLTSRYGNLVRAWRQHLDPDGDGRLQFTEFCTQCRAIGFQGNLKALWLSLDVDDTGDISLSELDPEAVAHIEDFKRLLTIFFDDLDTAWYTAMDPDASGRCSQDEFQRGCAMLGYQWQASQLFRYFDIRDEKHISVEHLEMYLDVLQLPRATSQADALRFCCRATGLESRATFESFLKERFGGSLTHCWRVGLCIGPREGHWSEQINAEAFCARCRTLGFRGDYIGLWTELLSNSTSGLCGHPERRRLFHTQRSAEEWGKVLASGSDAQMEALGCLNLSTLLPEVDRELLAFRAACEARCPGGGVEGVWRALVKACLKPSVDVRLRKGEFVQAARGMGFQGNAEVVFDACDIDMEHTISSAELNFLQIAT